MVKKEPPSAEKRPDEGALAALPAALLPWFAKNARDLPWRRDREPYHVWLSEIMLQQTRVETVKGYYERFLRALPDIQSLAGASTDRLHKLWEGLGYYARVRNLQTAARQIMAEHGGVFPSDYGAIRALKGIGDYTAAAVASICFELPTPAVDGNVLRAVSRLTGDGRPINEDKTKAAIRESLRKIYPPRHCGDFTQALMELGAVVCVPNGAPDCAACPAAALCRSRDGGWRTLPVKAVKPPRRREELTVFVLRRAGAVALRRRDSRGLLAGLWELPNLSGHLAPEDAAVQAERWGVRPFALLREARKVHIFTHVEWDMLCYFFDCRAEAGDMGFVWADAAARRGEYALPTAFRKFLETEDAP